MNPIDIWIRDASWIFFDFFEADSFYAFYWKG